MSKEINIFRVRKNFEDIKSQKGAFLIFESAVLTARKFGLNVYGNHGKLLFCGAPPQNSEVKVKSEE